MNYKHKIFNRVPTLLLATFALLTSCGSRKRGDDDSQSLTTKEIFGKELIKDNNALTGTSSEDILACWFPGTAEDIYAPQVTEDLNFLTRRADFTLKSRGAKAIIRSNKTERNKLIQAREEVKKAIPEPEKQIRLLTNVLLAIELKKAEGQEEEMKAANKLLEETIKKEDKKRIDEIKQAKDLTSLEDEKREIVADARESLRSLAEKVAEFNKIYTDFVEKHGKDKIVSKKKS